MEMNNPVIQFLYFEGCPLAPRARDNLVRAIRSLLSPSAVSFEEIDLMSDNLVERARYHGRATGRFLHLPNLREHRWSAYHQGNCQRHRQRLRVSKQLNSDAEEVSRTRLDQKRINTALFSFQITAVTRDQRLRCVRVRGMP